MALAEAQTTYGVIGIKVWIFKGEVFDQPEMEAAEAEAEAAAATGRQNRRSTGRSGRRLKGNTA
jgi:small subunit ribosomal protein S3